MLPRNNDEAGYLEDQMVRRSRQIPERGYAGMGYWYTGYPIYLGALSTQFGGLTSALSEPSGQAQPEAGSKIDSAASEAGATSSGQSAGTAGTAAASGMGTV